MIQPGKGGVRIDGDSKVGCNCRYKLDRSKIGSSEVDGGDNEIKKKSQKISKSKNSTKLKKTERFSDFFTLKAILAFIKLR